MKRIDGIIEKVYVVINTTNYNNDGKYAVTTARLSEMTELGFREDELEKLSDVDVDTLITTDFVGCYVMRIA